jgi:catechol 2,3-dioxygenase-like lactoylglutathione lyase family enzyme
LNVKLTVEALDHLVLNVADVETSAAWYQRVIGMVREDFKSAQGQMRTSVKFGRQKINLRPLTASKAEWFTADHEKAGSADLCFLTRSGPAEVADHLRSCGVAIEAGPVRKVGARGTLVSVYCRDPDGSLIEISSYPD